VFSLPLLTNVVVLLEDMMLTLILPLRLSTLSSEVLVKMQDTVAPIGKSLPHTIAKETKETLVETPLKILLLLLKILLVATSKSDVVNPGLMPTASVELCAPATPNVVDNSVMLTSLLVLAAGLWLIVMMMDTPRTSTLPL
jgi:hypothetical protein